METVEVTESNHHILLFSSQGKKYQQIYLYSFHIIFLTSLTRVLHFSRESHYTHATQDTDHGAPYSLRETITD
jgi:hypothetical protein